nr:hypothetical protein [Fulvivirga aurantia]
MISTRRFVLILLLLEREKRFLLFIGIAFFLTGIFFPYPQIAMWLGFGLAAYSAVANDSIQTIGTFIASNSDKKWWVLWMFVGLIFLATVSYSWIVFDGDVSFQRLSSKGFGEAPSEFAFLQIAAPLFLLILTRLKMPVSTTFLLLSSFTTSTQGLTGVLQKSVSGYIIAFVVAFVVWIALYDFLKKQFKGEPKNYWTAIQWIISGFLWSLWIIQDAANIAVFLPRSLNLIQFLIFSGTIFFGLGLIFFLKGDKIQQIVEEKSEVKDVRPATIIDLVYTCILIVFTWINTVPMSTTWVFIGLLGGRELAIKLRKKKDLKRTWGLIRKDLVNALIGLAVSIIIAIAANKELSDLVLSYF